MKSDVYFQNVPYKGILITDWQYIVNIYYDKCPIEGSMLRSPYYAPLTHQTMILRMGPKVFPIWVLMSRVEGETPLAPGTALWTKYCLAVPEDKQLQWSLVLQIYLRFGLCSFFKLMNPCPIYFIW